jgi:hypothetical protein
LIVTGSIESTTGLTGSLLGTASYTNQALSSSFALTASYADRALSASYSISSSHSLTASYVANASSFPFTGSAIITGSLIVTGSITSTQGFTGSLQGTASYANQTLTASYATTSSYLTLLQQQIILSGSLKLDPTQDPDPIGLDLDSTVLFQSSSNTALGYDLYVRQNGNLVKWKWIEGILETGLLYGGAVTYSGSNVFVSPGSGIIVDHNATTGSEISPMIEYITWNAITQSITNIASQQVTYLYIDNNGTLQQQSTLFTSQQYHDYIPLGAVGHFDFTQVSAFGGGVQTAYDQISQMSNFVDAFGPLKVSGYGITGQPGSLRLSIGSGISFIHGGFYQNNPEFPSQITTPAVPTASFAYLYRSGSGVQFDTNGGNFYTALRPEFYDPGTGITGSVSNNDWTIQRLYSDPKTGIIYLYYGQNIYPDYLTAVADLSTDSFTEGDTFAFTTFIGFLILKSNTSDITDTSDNKIVPAGLFRGSGQGSGGGIALSNLDDLTDVSITSPVNGQALIYNSGIWQNGNPTSASYSQTALSSSYALTASYASTYAPVFPFTGSAIITGSLEVTGSIRALVTGSDFVNIGNASTTNQRLVRIGQNTAFVDIGSLVGSTTNSAIYFNQANPSISNSAIYGNATGTVINSTGTITLSTNITPILTLSALGTTTLNPIASTTGAITGVTITIPANTGQTATTNIPNFRITGANKQWATGNITNQYWNYLTANTASFVGASTVTSSYGLFVEAATAGTNATITNNYAAGFSGNVHAIVGTSTNGLKFQGWTADTTIPAVYNQATPSAANYSLLFETINSYINATSTVHTRINNSSVLTVSATQLLLASGVNIATNATTGTKIGTTNLQKLSFWDVTPIVQPTASTAIDTLLTNTGLRATGGGANFNTPITASIISASAFIGNLSGSATSASYATTSSYATNFVVEGTLVINETLTDSATINSSIVGSNNLFTQATGSYTSAFGKYTISNGSNARAGEFMTVWNGTTTTYTDTSTTDIGNTADITFTSTIVSSNIQIDAVAASSGWTIKMLTTFI